MALSLWRFVTWNLSICNLVGSRDQSWPCRAVTVEVDLLALGRGPALQAQSQRVNPALLGPPASPGGWLDWAPETELEADTQTTRLRGKNPERNHSVYLSSSLYLSHPAPHRCAALLLLGCLPWHCRPRPPAPVRRPPSSSCRPGLGAGEGPRYLPPPLQVRSPSPAAWEVGWEGVEVTPQRSNMWDPKAWWPHHPNTGTESHDTEWEEAKGRSLL